MNQCYRLSAGRLLMASSFSLSTARVYFSVCFKPLWPSRLATVLMLAPLLRMFTAKEWRAQCQLMCLSMPARFTHRLTDLQQLSYDGRLKTRDSFVSPSFGLPTRWMSPSLRGMVMFRLWVLRTPCESLTHKVFLLWRLSKSSNGKHMTAFL